MSPRKITSSTDEFEENYMTLYVNAISGKSIRIKCDKKQKADTVFEKKKNEILNDKKTIEESNVEAETTIEMSLRLLGGMEKTT